LKFSAGSLSLCFGRANKEVKERGYLRHSEVFT